MAYITRERYSAVRDFILNDDPDNEQHVGTIYFPLSIIIAYLLFIKWIGPMIMKPLKPLRMNGVLIAFNVFIVIWNAYVSFNLAYIIYDSSAKGLFCNMASNEVIYRYYLKKAYKFGWLFYLSKYVDLLDTIFFILRKKQRQVSFLHVFHHTVVILLMWCGLRYKSRGGYLGVGLSLNSFVHVCTYSYYALSACGPKVQSFLNPKKIYLTFIQVAQFWIFLGYLLFSTVTRCEKLDVMFVTSAIFMSILMVLFANFYVQNYKKKQ